MKQELGFTIRELEFGFWTSTKWELLEYIAIVNFHHFINSYLSTLALCKFLYTVERTEALSMNPLQKGLHTISTQMDKQIKLSPLHNHCQFTITTCLLLSLPSSLLRPPFLHMCHFHYVPRTVGSFLLKLD